jgi:hypothetical protein
LIYTYTDQTSLPLLPWVPKKILLPVTFLNLNVPLEGVHKKWAFFPLHQKEQTPVRVYMPISKSDFSQNMVQKYSAKKKL